MDTLRRLLVVFLFLFLATHYRFAQHIAILTNAEAIDQDEDGIDDTLEDQLLQRFSPYYLFSKNDSSVDTYKPTDVVWYITRSELLPSGDEQSQPINPTAILVEHGLLSQRVMGA